MCGFHAPGRFDEIVPLDDCKLASERGNALREQVLAELRRQGLGAWDRRDAARLPAQPRRPRGPPHRRAAGAARHLARQARRRRADRRGRRRGPVLDADRRARREHPGRRDAAARAARRSCTSSSATCDFLISPEAFFQTNTEMAEVLYGARGRGRRRCAATSASSTSTAASARSASRWPRGRARSSASRSSSRRSPTRSRTRGCNEITNASFFAGDIRLAMRELVERAGKPDVAVIDPPRAGLSQKVVRRIIEAAPEADRLRLLQPDDARAERRAARRGGLRR